MSQSHDPVLDAARECVLAVGVRRTTFSDVARRAGVSRMTLYRRFGDLEALLSALMTREFGRLVAAAQPENGASARHPAVQMALGRAPPARGRLALPAPAGRRSGAAAALRDAAPRGHAADG